MNTVFPEPDYPETIIDQGCLNREQQRRCITDNNILYLQLQTYGDTGIHT